MSGTLHLTITFHPPDKRKRDIDNMLASIKSGLDGIADAIEVDDYNWVITIQRAEPVSGGAINIGISKHELDG
jgi:crossover junction endodeoxyribonuclease RusA